MECDQLAGALAVGIREQFAKACPAMNWVLLRNSFLVASMTTVVAASFGLLAALWLGERLFDLKLLPV